MLSNIKRLSTFALLVGAANFTVAAPAPVSDLNGANSGYSGSQSETPMQRLERLLRNQNHVQLQMQQQLDAMSDDLQTLRGQVERNSHETSQMLERQRELFVELDKLRQQKAVPQAHETEQATGKGQEETELVGNAAEQKAYQDAVDLILKERNYAGAITAFNQFRESYPNSSFTPNAFYWLGQLYFAQQNNAEAIHSFESVVKYKSSNKRADALVKLGELEFRNKNKEKATAYYKQVIQEYPDSASAKTAKSKLSQ